MSKRKICVVTGTRAEYGLLYWLMREIQDDPELQLQIVVTGMHLSPEYGLTYQLIEQDGFVIDEKVEMLLSSDTSVGIATSLGLGTIGFAGVFDRLAPNIVVVLGDRFEILAAAQAAMVARIPLAHLHGGETTEGVIDEAIRHSVTKMSHLHFVSTETYRNRVIQMGEQPERVYTVGAIGLDNIRKMDLMDRPTIERSINFSLKRPSFLITYHPVTLEKGHSETAIKELFHALDEFPNATCIFTKPNADMEGRTISKMIDEYVYQRPSTCKSFVSLGQLRYLSAIQHVDVVIGNSSSGILEVPYFRKPTVNLGDRQKGRIQAASVIDCMETKESICDAIKMALSHEFHRQLQKIHSPYGEDYVSGKVKKVLKEVDLSLLLKKSFYDLSLEV
ncbi:UDP-N-acetyl glucosamine 2-epimerase [Brevibacillus reuszeri]|uniref:UDP-N-acetyl glucosamine 2-epimerase n=1 Tax=Brevibacillus reuszeri TaxID=54915 RepID=A0A0K9YUN4_9BACL|nr:UDP-N-acetylglucosamine 2-epimerase [Brevibacillus reuszeri]KNB71900.1 UDP-N-acetylglucosamine 2-epimerase [Brevibacillus reuszeri]MED1855266.1 UDP-N-acetylglucosamine 2-epimerase [Brevibacillus reuszeri]GED67583.1 UDP-N-acetyl glucosamine 2-epimerase [Brevibacillus reuszeri]